MEKVKINTDYIKLDQFLKFTGIVEMGSYAKGIIAEGKIKVNGNIETQRGKKLRKGDIVEAFGKFYEIIKDK